MNPSSFFFPTLTRYVQAWFKSTIFRTHLVLCGNLSFFITHYGPALVTPSHAGAAPPGFFVLFPARTVIVPAGSMRKFTIPLPFSSPVCFIRRGLRPALLPMLQRLAVVMALPPVTRGLDGYNAGFGGFVALLVEELANGAILIRREDMFPYRIKLVKLNVAK